MFVYQSFLLSGMDRGWDRGWITTRNWGGNFRRFARGLELTDDGRRYLPRLTSALDEIASVTGDLRCERTGQARPGSQF